MRGLLGDRFIRKFAGELKNRRKNQNSIGEGNNPEAEVAAASEPAAPEPEAVRLDSYASEEDCEETDAASVPTKAEPNKQDEGGPIAD